MIRMKLLLLIMPLLPMLLLQPTMLPPPMLLLLLMLLLQPMMQLLPMHPQPTPPTKAYRGTPQGAFGTAERLKHARRSRRATSSFVLHHPHVAASAPIISPGRLPAAR